MVRDINSYITTIKNQIEKNHDEILSLSHEIHDNPEIGNQEVKACKWLTDLLIKHGFEVKVNIATHPTGFIARKKGQNKGPVIGLLAEYDALKGLGHACGHNIIEQVEKLWCLERRLKRVDLMGMQKPLMLRPICLKVLMFV